MKKTLKKKKIDNKLAWLVYPNVQIKYPILSLYDIKS
jgi:hypothetical protein